MRQSHPHKRSTERTGEFRDESLLGCARFPSSPFVSLLPDSLLRFFWEVPSEGGHEQSVQKACLRSTDDLLISYGVQWLALQVQKQQVLCNDGLRQTRESFMERVVSHSREGFLPDRN